MSNIKSLLSIIIFTTPILFSVSSRADLTPESQARLSSLMQEYFNQEWVRPFDPVSRLRSWLQERLIGADESVRSELGAFLLSERSWSTILEIVQRRRANATAIIATHLIGVIRALPFYWHDDVHTMFRARLTQLALLDHLQSHPVTIDNSINPPDFLNFLRSPEAIAIIASILHLAPRDAASTPQNPEIHYSIRRTAERRRCKAERLEEEEQRGAEQLARRAEILNERAGMLEEEERTRAERLAKRAERLNERAEKLKEKLRKRLDQDAKLQHALRRGAEESAKRNAKEAQKVERNASRSSRKRKSQGAQKQSKRAAPENQAAANSSCLSL